MNFNYNTLKILGDKYGDSFYLLDSKTFKKNYKNLLSEFKKYYSKTNIAYSYKTNYIPKLCKIVDELGGYAEVVSSMEFQIARSIGVEYEKIYYNGPYKDFPIVEELLLNGGVVNIDSLDDFTSIKRISEGNIKNEIKIGIRLNFDVEDGMVSRFGFDVEGKEINTLISELKNFSNIKVVGIHTHFSQRSLKVWESKIEGLKMYIQRYLELFDISFVSLGGGLFGNMDESLKQQFSSKIPTFNEYAQVAAKGFAEIFEEYSDEKKPILYIEPGSALAGDSMMFCSKVYGIKNVRGKDIATLLGSIYNINPTLNTKNPPIKVYSNNSSSGKAYANLDFGGFTCIESDYLYKGYSGELNVNDYVVFSNVGSYSIVLKPPFILPNFAILDICEDVSQPQIIKRKENYNDLFFTYNFEV